MNREIKFRGQDMKGRWCYGSLDYNAVHNEAYIIEYCWIDHDGVDVGEYVDRVGIETVGQYTGLKDKNGKEIYEGDILIKKDENAAGWTRVRTCKVEWSNNWGCWYIETTLGDGYSLSKYKGRQLEVIGNIYENPELLETE
jgi:uncharacterized phage protein (TIGR01671 family)